MSTGDWTPTSDEEKSLKDAVIALQSSTKGAVENIDKPDVPRRFVLNSKGVFEFKAYVMSGKQLPSKEGDFERQMPEQAFNELRSSDPEIYYKTKRMMVTIGQSCGDYYNNHLMRILAAASAATRYADHAIDMLVTAEGMNLKHHLEVLLDKKYKSNADQDDNFQESREAATMTVQILREDAEDRKKEINDLLAPLATLKTTVIAVQPEVDSLAQRLKTESILNSAYNSKVEEIKQKLQQATETSTEWGKKPGMKVGFSFWPGIGWVVTDVTASQGTALRDAFNDLQRQIEDMQKNDREKLELNTKLRMMIEQSANAGGKINATIEALKELSLFFSNQSTAYDKINAYLNGIGRGARTNGGSAFVNSYMDSTIGRLDELKKTVQEFQQNIVREVER